MRRSILTHAESEWLELNGFTDNDIQQLPGGGNNKLYQIASNNERFILKKYLNDDRKRLTHEWQTLKLLELSGIATIPRPILANPRLDICLYSYVNGKTINVEALRARDIDQIINFMSQMQSIKLSSSSKYKLKAPYFRRNYSGYFSAIQKRLKSVKGHTAIIRQINVELEAIRSRYNSDLFVDFIPKEIKISQVDWGIHNMIKIGNQLHFVDFEYAGLDHHLKAPADFLCHDTFQSAPLELKRYFYDNYIRFNMLNSLQVMQLNMSIRLINLEWVAIYLQSIDKEKIQSKILNHKLRKNELKSYLQKKMLSINNRLRAEALAYVFD